MADATFDVAVIGGGVVGTAVALTLSRDHRARVVLLEAEPRLAAHQSGRNSGVVHSGLYYKPGSLKARLCVGGARQLEAFCGQVGVPLRRCGKLVVATEPDEVPRLAELERRGAANGLPGLRRLGPDQIRDYEPHAAGLAALHVPQTSVVDFAAVVRAYADQARLAGAEIRLGARVIGCAHDGAETVLTTGGGEVRCRSLVNCAGLQSDRIARLCGARPDVRIVPFRGEYSALRPARAHLVRGLIYPVPDPRFPFLGVHFTRRIDDRVEAGPNAVLAFAREGYTYGDISPRDLWETATFPGFWRMARQYAGMGLGEFRRSLSRSALVRALRRLVPELRGDDLAPGGAGVRAQALSADGRLLDDFRIIETERMIHVLNAPSPAATASLAIAADIAARWRKRGSPSVAN